MGTLLRPASRKAQDRAHRGKPEGENEVTKLRKAPPVNRESHPLRRIYTPQQLRDLWDFCQHDFDRLIELLLWLDELDEPNARLQLDSARSLFLHKKSEKHGWKIEEKRND